MTELKIKDVGEVKELGYGPIKGADHKNPAYHYGLVEGVAFADQQDGWRKLVLVTPEMVKGYTYSHKLGWVTGKTVAIFEKGEETLAQYLPGGAAGAKKMKEAKPKEESIVQKLKAERAAEPTAVVNPKNGKVVAPKAEKAQPKKVIEPKVKKAQPKKVIEPKVKKEPAPKKAKKVRSMDLL